MDCPSVPRDRLVIAGAIRQMAGTDGRLVAERTSDTRADPANDRLVAVKFLSLPESPLQSH